MAIVRQSIEECMAERLLSLIRATSSVRGAQHQTRCSVAHVRDLSILRRQQTVQQRRCRQQSCVSSSA